MIIRKNVRRDSTSNIEYSLNSNDSKKKEKNPIPLTFSLLLICGVIATIQAKKIEPFFSIAAVAVSFLSVYTAVLDYKSNVSMNNATIQNYLVNSRPYIQMFTEYHEDNNEFVVYLCNHGVGPAMITELWAWDTNAPKHDKVKFYHTVHDAFTNSLIHSPVENIESFVKFNVGGMTDIDGYTIPANGRIVLLQFQFNKNYDRNTITDIIEIASTLSVYCAYVDIYNIDKVDIINYRNKPFILLNSGKPSERDKILASRRQFEFERNLRDILSVSKWMDL